MDRRRFPASHHEPILHECLKELPPFNQVSSPVIQNDDVKLTIDLQAELDRTFDQSFQSVFQSIIPANMIESLYETLYTLYIYEAERDGMATTMITTDIINHLMVEYEIEIPQQVVLPKAFTMPAAHMPAAHMPAAHIQPMKWFSKPPVLPVESRHLKFFNDPKRKIKKTLHSNNARRARENYSITQRRINRNAKTAKRRQKKPYINVSRNPESVAYKAQRMYELQQLAELGNPIAAAELKSFQRNLYGPSGASVAASSMNSSGGKRKICRTKRNKRTKHKTKKNRR